MVKLEYKKEYKLNILTEGWTRVIFGRNKVIMLGVPGKMVIIYILVSESV